MVFPMVFHGKMSQSFSPCRAACGLQVGLVEPKQSKGKHHLIHTSRRNEGFWDLGIFSMSIFDNKDSHISTIRMVAGNNDNIYDKDNNVYLYTLTYTIYIYIYTDFLQKL